MTDEEIKQARENYNKLLVEKEELEKMKKRITELETTSLVKEYIELCKLTTSVESKKIDVEVAFDDIAKNTKDSNRIFVYMGSYFYNISYETHKIDGSKPGYPLLLFWYKDLETLKEHYKKNENRDSFEKNHNVIYLIDEKNNYGHSKETELKMEERFQKLREQFFKELLTKPQDEVVKQFVRRRNK